MYIMYQILTYTLMTELIILMSWLTYQGAMYIFKYFVERF